MENPMDNEGMLTQAIVNYQYFSGIMERHRRSGGVVVEGKRITPIYDQVVCRRVEKARYGGKVVIPETTEMAREKPCEAIVVAVGFGKVTDDGVLVPLAARVGDRVLVGKYAGSEFKFSAEGDEYLIVREIEIKAAIDVLEESAEPDVEPEEIEEADLA